MTELNLEADISTYVREESAQDRLLGKLFHRSERLTLFDVGACEGEDSIRYAALFPEARIFAFEPLAANQSLLLANFKKFHVSTAELVGVALSDRTGMASFHISSGEPPDRFRGDDWNYGNKSSSLLPPASAEPMFGWLRFDRVAEVSCKKLDDFCAERGVRRIDFLHMDVQGAETLVLAGAREMIRKTTAIWLEVSEEELYKGQGLRPAVERWMRERGFARCLEVRRGAEGDQFYVNLRYPRVWRTWIGAKMSSVWRRLRGALGRWRRRAWKPFSPG